MRSARESNGRLGWSRTLGASFLAVLGRPDLWAVALAGFLVRGGLLLFTVPILVLPTAIGIANFVGPLAITPGGPSPTFVTLVAAATLAVLVWLVVAGLVGALVDVALVREALRDAGDLHGEANVAGVWPAVESAADAELAAPGRGRLIGDVGRLLVVRAVSVVPLVLAVGWGIGRLIDVAYRELTAPGDLAVPLVIRIVQAAPDVTAGLLVAWLLGEALGALAARHVIVLGMTAARALRSALVDLVRRPLAAAGTSLATLAVSAFFVGPPLVGSWIALRLLRVLVVRADRPELVLIAALIFVSTWTGALVIAGAASAWRSVLWSFEANRGWARRPVEGAPSTDPRSVTGMASR